MATSSHLSRSPSPFDPVQLAEHRERTLAKHPLLGGLLVGMITNDARSQEGLTWGAEGVALVAATLQKRLRPTAHLLRDVRLPDTGAVVDYVVVAPSGVWVVSVHRCRGRVEVRKPLFGSPSLRVAGRDKTSLSHELAGAVEAIGATVAEHLPGTSVRGVLCFVDAELPLLGTLTISGQLLLTRKALARRVAGGGSVSSAEARALVAVLGRRFEIAEARVGGVAPGNRMPLAA